MSAPTSTDPPAGGTARAVVLLGSNIAPAFHLVRALERLRESVSVLAVSRVFESDPVDAPGTPRFLNAAVLIETTRSPAGLKREILRPLEAELGRVRTEIKSAPRTIDLDLVLYEQAVIEDAERGLHLPDPDFEQHAYLALPVADVTPLWLHPTLKKTFAAIAEPLRDLAEIEPTEIPSWPRESPASSSSH